jgi:ABC-type sugar transport system substrate-binding protein
MRSTGRRHALTALLALAALVLCLGLAACGGGSSSSGSSSGSSESSGTESGEGTATTASDEGSGSSGSVPMPPTAPQKGIGVKTPLKSKPEADKTVGWLQCSLPSCETFKGGFEKAAAALGWHVHTFVYESGKPGPAMQQAIDAGVDYIAITGQPPALYEPQLKQAKAAGIPIISGNDTTPPNPAEGVYTQFEDGRTYGKEAQQTVEWLLNKYEGEAQHIAYVTIADYPILEAGYEYLQKTAEKYCSECSTSEIVLTPEELGAGKAPSKIVATLQSDPEINALDFTVPDLLGGVGTALQSAGIEGVKMLGVAFGHSPEVLKGIESGEVSAWVAQPVSYEAWLMVDSMARLSEGMPLTEEHSASVLPTWVIDDPSAFKYLEPNQQWEGPPGFEGEFESLWGV